MLEAMALAVIDRALSRSGSSDSKEMARQLD